MVVRWDFKTLFFINNGKCGGNFFAMAKDLETRQDSVPVKNMFASVLIKKKVSPVHKELKGEPIRLVFRMCLKVT